MTGQARGGGEAAPGTLLLFWDYDTQWGADRSRGGTTPSWGPLEFAGTERVLTLLAEFDVDACFAVVGRAAGAGERPYADAQQVRRIHAAGHEVASHSHRHEWLPGLSAAGLEATIRDSRDAIEQCIGAPVVTFVPPFNEPFDHPGGGAFSLSERIARNPERADIRRLCECLFAGGYRCCRIAYRPLHLQLVERLFGRCLERPGAVELIGGIACVRLNTPGGFDRPATDMVERCAREGGIAVVYGHPHSIQSGNSQDEYWLRRFLTTVTALRAGGRLQVRLPGTLAAGEQPDSARHAAAMARGF